MKIRLQDGLPFVTVSLTHHDKELMLENVLLDTGSVGTIFSTDQLYSFHLDGIIGMDFLLQVGAKIDLAQLDMS